MNHQAGIFRDNQLGNFTMPLYTNKRQLVWEENFTKKRIKSTNENSNSHKKDHISRNNIEKFSSPRNNQSSQVPNKYGYNFNPIKNYKENSVSLSRKNKNVSDTK